MLTPTLMKFIHELTKRGIKLLGKSVVETQMSDQHDNRDNKILNRKFFQSIFLIKGRIILEDFVSAIQCLQNRYGLGLILKRKITDATILLSIVDPIG